MYVHLFSRNLINRVQAFTQLLNGPYGCAPEFLDDYRLLVSLAPTFDTSHSLVLMDIEKFEGGLPEFIHLFLSPTFAYSAHSSLLLERGMHKPSIPESLAPFHPDPSQRILVFRSSPNSPCLVLRVQALLELLAGSDVGSCFSWQMWVGSAIAYAIDLSLWEGLHIWVSGSRLFSLHGNRSGSGPWLEAFDFSVRSHFDHQSRNADKNLTQGRIASFGQEGVQIQLDDVLDVYAGHDSIALSEVSALL